MTKLLKVGRGVTPRPHYSPVTRGEQAGSGCAHSKILSVRCKKCPSFKNRVRRNLSLCTAGCVLIQNAAKKRCLLAETQTDPETEPSCSAPAHSFAQVRAVMFVVKCPRSDQPLPFFLQCGRHALRIWTK